MADTKLSALPELAATPATNDEIYIRDESEAAANESKRITIANLLASVMLNSVANANSMLYSVTNDTPAALAVAASRMIGRKSTGNIVALTAAELLTIINVDAGADVTGSNPPQAHTIVFHDTTATGANLNTLIGGGETTLHSHAATGATIASPSTTVWDGSSSSPTTFTDLDLSSVVGSKPALIILEVTRGANDCNVFEPRANGLTASFFRWWGHAAGANISNDTDEYFFILFTDSSGIIEWKTSTGVTGVVIKVTLYVS